MLALLTFQLVLLPSASGTVLLTGFGPFGEHEANISYQGIKELDGSTLKGRTLATLQLPTAWNQSRNLLFKELADRPPRAVVSAGIDAHAQADVVVEAYARNRTVPLEDIYGNLPPAHGKIVPGGTPVIPSPLSADAAVEALRSAGIDAAAGTDPGGYLCGWVYYLLLHALDDAAPAVFLHIKPDISPETLQQAILITAELLLGADSSE